MREKVGHGGAGRKEASAIGDGAEYLVTVPGGDGGDGGAVRRGSTPGP
jgi:hypothetical protein